MNSKNTEETRQFLLAYDAFIRTPGICHVIVFDRPEPPVVVVGELDDNPSTSATNAIETVADAISRKVLPGRTDFDLFEYVPKGLPAMQPTFYRVTWEGGRPFRWPVWNRVDPSAEVWLQMASKYVTPSPYLSTQIRGERIDATSREVFPVSSDE